MYHRPDDNGLVLDLSTDYRVRYLLWKYFKPYTTHPCVHYPSMNIHVYTQIDWLYILLEALTYVLLLWTISNPHSSFTRLEEIFSTFNFSSFYRCLRHLDCHSKKYHRLVIRNNRNVLLMVLEAGGLRSGCCMAGFRRRLAELQVADFLLYPHMVGGGGNEEVLQGAPPSQPHHLPKAPPPDTIP